MNDAVTAVADLFRAVPTRVRQTLYGVLGLLILIDGWWDVFPDDIGGKVSATFAGLTLIMALANATAKPLPPPVPLEGGVDAAFPDEFA